MLTVLMLLFGYILSSNRKAVAITCSALSIGQTGKKVSQRKDELREIVEHFNVSKMLSSSLNFGMLLVLLKHIVQTF